MKFKEYYHVETLKENIDNATYYHGTSTNEIFNGKYCIHIGTKQAATEALEARIGIPAEGEWDGTREYGKTLLAGRKDIDSNKYGKYRLTGFNCDAQDENYYPQNTKGKLATYSDGTIVPLTSKPKIFKVKIIGKMTNTPDTPISDIRANSSMKSLMNRGIAKSGYYYKNEAEDSGSISAVVPNKSFLKIIEDS